MRKKKAGMKSGISSALSQVELYYQGFVKKFSAPITGHDKQYLEGYKNTFLNEVLPISTSSELANVPKGDVSLAITLDYMFHDREHEGITTIREDLTKKIPMSLLVRTWLLMYPDKAFKYLQVDDEHMLKMMLSGTHRLPTSALLVCANVVGLEIQRHVNKLWNICLQEVFNGPNSMPLKILSENVSHDISKWAIRERCKKKASFLDHSNKELMRGILTDGERGMKDVRGDEFCEAVGNLDIISDASVNGKIRACRDKLENLVPGPMHTKENLSGLKDTYGKLMDLASKWNVVSTYTTSRKSGERVDALQKLDQIAMQVDQAVRKFDDLVEGYLEKKKVELKERRYGNNSLDSFSFESEAPAPAQTSRKKR